MKTWRNVVIIFTVLAGLSIISVPVVKALAPHMYIQILNDSGAIINGATAGASVFAPKEYVSALDSTGHIINTFGGGGGTVTTSAPISGDGSVGTPVTMATTANPQVNSLGVGVAADAVAGDLLLNNVMTFNTAIAPPTSVPAPKFFWSTINSSIGAGVSCRQSTGTNNCFSVYGSSGSQNFEVQGGGGVAITSDNAVLSMPRMPMAFSINQQTALIANEHMGTFKTVKAMTIENIVLDAQNVTCAVSAVVTCFDCGTSAGACTSSQTSTIATSAAIATGAASSVDMTVSTAAVAAAHYITCEVTAGTCATLQANLQMMARPQ